MMPVPIEGIVGSSTRMQQLLTLVKRVAAQLFEKGVVTRGYLGVQLASTLDPAEAGDPAYAPDAVHEAYHTGGARELKWRDELLAGGRECGIGDRRNGDFQKRSRGKSAVLGVIGGAFGVLFLAGSGPISSVHSLADWARVSSVIWRSRSSMRIWRRRVSIHIH